MGIEIVKQQQQQHHKESVEQQCYKSVNGSGCREMMCWGVRVWGRRYMRVAIESVMTKVRGGWPTKGEGCCHFPSPALSKTCGTRNSIPARTDNCF